MSRILITGASGFIGRAAVAALAAAGHEVRAATRRPGAATLPGAAELVPLGDLEGTVDWRALLAGMDAVVHLAGIAHASGVAAVRHDRVNRAASEELARAASAAGIRRLVFMSTIRAQTGPAADRIVTEALEPQPTDAYGRSKLAAEQALLRSGVAVTVLRPVPVYGAGMKGNLHALMRLAALKIPLPFGAFVNRRSLVSLQSLLAAIPLALDDTSPGETYVVADPQPVSLAEIVTALRHGLGRRPGLVAVPRSLIRLGLTALGRREDWDRLDATLVADPRRLIAAGWRPEPDTMAALAATARDWHADAAG